MRVIAAEGLRAFAWLLALVSGAPLWASRKLYKRADRLEGRQP